MPPDILGSLKNLWRRQRYEFLTGDRIICKSPGFLVAAKMTGTLASTSTVKLYDGENANEPQICELSALGMGSDQFCPSLPIPFLRGLFADFGSTAATLTVTIITTRE